jgi:hypothetical protein
MTRTLYRRLVGLHPPGFRARFEEELLWIFDESSAASNGWPLVYDAAISLLRQWLLRSGMWKWLVAGIAGTLPIIIGFGTFLFPWAMRQ